MQLIRWGSAQVGVETLARLHCAPLPLSRVGAPGRSEPRLWRVRAPRPRCTPDRGRSVSLSTCLSVKGPAGSARRGAGAESVRGKRGSVALRAAGRWGGEEGAGLGRAPLRPPRGPALTSVPARPRRQGPRPGRCSTCPRPGLGGPCACPAGESPLPERFLGLGVQPRAGVGGGSSLARGLDVWRWTPR